ncbi:hypothetical protein IAR55_000649 [Kwoniella newhampshirensis]|uniref:FAD dependent oxidoreductase domain-containing protein n=1 Tax=Kwoniella newhampshirensis TaxID=1651941 RepID=A0AAW0Z7C9_9TREE
MTTSKPSVLIVGAGEFGAATAVSLLRSNLYSAITVLDRASTLPASDAASCDINKVVRFDYADEDYAVLARKAIEEWNKEDWKGIYHQSGVVIRGMEDPGIDGQGCRQAYENVQKIEPSVQLLSTPSDFISALSSGSGDVLVTTPAPDIRGYRNPVGGWANASLAVEKLYEQSHKLGGRLVPGAEMSELLFTEDGKDVRGVRCLDGSEYLADKVVVALGSWTPSHPALKGLIPQGLVTATGQTVAAVQLCEQDRERYKKIPVTMHLDGSAYYSFPPNETGLVKFALHGAGYLTENGVPRTAADPKAIAYAEANGLGWIPKESLEMLRQRLSLDYPELARMPIAYTRMCWYSDVVDGDWVIDISPDYPSLTFATGGAGHAFKFLPIIGDLIRARMEGTLDSRWREKWRIDRTQMGEDPARTGMARKPLDLSALVTAQDLLAVP